MVMIKYFALLGSMCWSGAAWGDDRPWFRESDYPKEALAARAEGTVGLAYDINEKGRVTVCTVTKSSGNAALDAVSCEMMIKRGRFYPKQDENGRPIASQGSRNVTWTLPR